MKKSLILVGIFAAVVLTGCFPAERSFDCKKVKETETTVSLRCKRAAAN